MDRRSTLIFDLIAKQSPISIDNISKKMGLTQRQIDYSVQKINQVLLEHHFTPMIKMAGMYYLSDDVIQWYAQGIELYEEYILSPVERVYCIIVVILLNHESISLEYLAFKLKVSRNTMLSDLKACQNILNEANSDLRLINSKINGYIITGGEWDKRAILRTAIRYLLRSCGEEQLSKLMQFSEAQKSLHIKQLSNVEQMLNVRYTDDDFRLLIYNLRAIKVRIFNQLYVENYFLIDAPDLDDTEEFQAAKEVLNEIALVPQAELSYIALQLLMSSSLNKELPNEEILVQLKEALEEFVINFEQYALVTIKDRDGLVDRLLKHFKPAYYKIKYKLTSNCHGLSKVNKIFDMLSPIVKRAIQPVEIYLGTKIPDHELAYVTLFMGSALIERQRMEPTQLEKIHAVIVCQNGLSLSNLMKLDLVQLFPEFVFYPTLSKREFEFFDLDYQIVFSSIQLKSDRPVFLVSELISEEEKYYLRKRVLGHLSKTQLGLIDMDYAMEVIRKYVDHDFNEEKMKESIFALLNHSLLKNNAFERKVTEGLHLFQVVEQSGVELVQRIDEWTEGIFISSQLLLEKHFIDATYQKQLLQRYHNFNPLIILNQTIAIPHLEPSVNVKRFGMGMVIAKEANENSQLPQIFVTIAVVNDLQHLEALNQLFALSKNQPLLNELYQAKSSVEVIQVLKKIKEI